MLDEQEIKDVKESLRYMPLSFLEELLEVGRDHSTSPVNLYFLEIVHRRQTELKLHEGTPRYVSWLVHCQHHSDAKLKGMPTPYDEWNPRLIPTPQELIDNLVPCEVHLS